MNPYFNQDGWGFCGLFFQRALQMIQGKIGLMDLASDEVQFFVLALIAFSGALVGAFLVLQKMTMLANSLSHTLLPGLVIAFLISRCFSSDSHFSLSSMPLSTLMLAAFATALLTSFATQVFSYLFKLQEDASIGLVCTSMVAIGVVLVTVFTRSTHLGVEAVMGNVDALHPHDLSLAAYVALFNGVAVVLFFKELKIVAFDPAYATTQGFSIKALHALLMLLTSMTVIGAFRAVGILLVLSFLVGPVLTARLFTRRLKWLILGSMGVGILTSFVSILLSRHLLTVYQMPLSTAGIVSTLLGVVYLVALGAKLTLQKIERTGTLAP